MTVVKRMLVLVCFMIGTLLGQDAKVTQLMSKDLAEFPGKEGRKAKVRKSSVRCRRFFILVLSGSRI
jgi:hypothetical protein